MKSISRALCLIGLIAVCAGCNPGARRGSDGVADLMKQLAPTTKLPPDGMLELPGASIPVAVNSSIKSDSFVVELSTFGEVLETESYAINDGQFALEEALGEEYDPVVPLLGVGSHIDNQSWNWKGVISSGGVKRKATAEIFGESGQIEVVGFTGDGRVVKINLSIESGESVKAERVLSFHFAVGKGLVQREFGHASTRTLAKPDADSSGSSKPGEPVKL